MFRFIIILLISFICTYGQTNKHQITSDNSVDELVLLLTNLAAKVPNSYFKMHCNSILQVINSRTISEYEKTFIEQIYNSFADTSVLFNASKLTSYTERKRPLIISWVSPADGTISPAWLLLPENWDSTKTYPVYVTLHGLSSPYSNPVEYMSRYLTPDRIMERSFEDGYILFPWGRGNIWYEGLGETDVWESIDALEKIFKIDPNRKYLMGFSMGGYGAWVIGQKSPDVWAAIGVFAGALWYSGNRYLNAEAAQNLKDVPVYIIVGTQDGLFGNNQTAYNLLYAAGNPNIVFETFDGGHEALLENWQRMYNWVREFSNDQQTSVKDKSELLDYKLYNNYPNPFNPVTNFGFRLPAGEAGIGDSRHGGQVVFVQFKIYDVLGNEIATLMNEEKPAGEYNIRFDGSKFPSGVYFYVLNAGGKSICKKMCLMK